MVQPNIVDEVIERVRVEVSEAIRLGVNWKVIINGAGSNDINYVVERHGKIKGKPQTK